MIIYGAIPDSVSLDVTAYRHHQRENVQNTGVLNSAMTVNRRVFSTHSLNVDDVLFMVV